MNSRTRRQDASSNSQIKGDTSEASRLEARRIAIRKCSREATRFAAVHIGTRLERANFAARPVARVALGSVHFRAIGMLAGKLRYAKVWYRPMASRSGASRPKANFSKTTFRTTSGDGLANHR